VVNLGAAGQGMVVGDLVNAASRVQALAEPGSVLVGEATRRATERAIAYSDAGTHEVKGRAEPIALWRALHITAGRRGDLKRDILEPPFVGRERELRLLKELFNAGADQRKAYLVSVIGMRGSASRGWPGSSRSISMASTGRFAGTTLPRDSTDSTRTSGAKARITPGQITPFVQALGARFAARRAVLRRDSETASAGFLAAARIFREIETPFELAFVLLEHAEWLAGGGQMDEVEGLAGEAREIFERLRAIPYLERLASLPQPLPVAAS
jgi:hypothetical protein